MLLVPRCKGVAGMHLDGEFIVWKKKLDEHGKLGKRSQPRAAPFRWNGMPAFAQSPAGERTVGKARIKRSEPGLPEGLLQIDFVRKPRSERMLAPDARTEKRL